MSAGSMVVLCICNLIVPLLMLGFGVRLRRRPPETVNGAFGYRTRRSMKNDATWRFAHEKCGKIWTCTGLILLLVSVAFSILLWIKGGDAMMRFAGSFSMAQVVVLLLTIVPVEHALKKHFDDNGDPKE